VPLLKKKKSQVCPTQSTGVGKIEDKMEGKRSLKLNVFFSNIIINSKYSQTCV
jgi:hypothetical protein